MCLRVACQRECVGEQVLHALADKGGNGGRRRGLGCSAPRHASAMLAGIDGILALAARSGVLPIESGNTFAVPRSQIRNFPAGLDEVRAASSLVFRLTTTWLRWVSETVGGHGLADRGKSGCVECRRGSARPDAESGACSSAQFKTSPRYRHLIGPPSAIKGVLPTPSRTPPEPLPNPSQRTPMCSNRSPFRMRGGLPKDSHRPPMEQSTEP